MLAFVTLSFRSFSRLHRPVQNSSPEPPKHYFHAFRLSLNLLVVWVDSLVSASQDSAAQIAHREVEGELDRRKKLSKE